ncbi:unnamed protein product [Moneuplotes crassus]|uniref:Calcium load-activated calcium channel n=1 Tax=Euplotes crassus TaxID=5936 RepID=A0AAD1XZB8_EUPCR|nr:unnamed protein product [Moneuplotes crassus]
MSESIVDKPFDIYTFATLAGLSLASSCVIELFVWWMVYRTGKYKNICSSAGDLIKKIEKDKDQLSPFVKNFEKKNKMIKQDEKYLSNLSASLSRMQMKSTFFIAIFMIFFISNLRSAFAGTLVVWLPITPFSFMQGMCHQKGDDWYGDFSIPFFFIFSNAAIRPLIRKTFGFNPPAGLQQNPMWPKMPEEEPYYSQ